LAIRSPGDDGGDARRRWRALGLGAVKAVLEGRLALTHVVQEGFAYPLSGVELSNMTQLQVEGQ